MKTTGLFSLHMAVYVTTLQLDTQTFFMYSAFVVCFVVKKIQRLYTNSL